MGLRLEDGAEKIGSVGGVQEVRRFGDDDGDGEKKFNVEVDVRERASALVPGGFGERDGCDGETMGMRVQDEQMQDDNRKRQDAARRQGSVMTIVGSALANLSDGYQQNLSNLTNIVFSHLLGSRIYTSAVKTRISNSLLVGNVFGILIFGYVADRFTRRQGMVVTTGLVLVGSFLCVFALEFTLPAAAQAMLWYMTVARGATGVGVGGEYPTSASAAIEASNESFDQRRGPIQIYTSTLMSTTGGPICVFVFLMSLIATGNDLTVAYHAIYAVSLFLPVVVLIVRLGMQNGRLFEESNFRARKIPWWLLLKTYWVRIAGVSAVFFLYDFINFPNSIMSSTIINGLVPGGDVRQVAIWQLILSAMHVPGPIVGSLICNRIGRRWTGIIGFILGYVVVGCIIGGLYKQLSTTALPAFVVLYGLLSSLGHMGPGSMIGLITVEAFPTATRGMAYGIAAGFSKAGAAIGTQVFLPIRAAAGPASTFSVAAGVGVVGSVIMYFLPEGCHVDLAREDAEFETLLAAHEMERENRADERL